MTKKRAMIAVLFTLVLAISAFGCQLVSPPPPTPTTAPTRTLTLTPPPTWTPMPPVTPLPVEPRAADEPFLITGEIDYTSPFFTYGLRDGFVLLEDQAGFITRDKEFEFSLSGQVIGPIEEVDEDTVAYSLLLPAVPQGTFVDVDQDGEDDQGVQVFAVAYWSNVWGGPFLERRDGTGWSTAYASTITDPERKDEIKGGILIVWAPDDQQSFPTGFGEDGSLFTEDDPTAPIPAGYNIVDLDEEPFRVYKEPQPQIDLNEGEVAVNDYADMDYGDAFDAMFEKASREYPFTEEKNIDWDALYDEFGPRAASADNDLEFFRAVRDFAWSIPDGHVGFGGDSDALIRDLVGEIGGGFGLILAELSDGSVIVTHVFPDLPAEEAGIAVGAEIIAWDGQPVGEAIDQVIPYFGPYSTDHTRRVAQVVFLTRVPPDAEVSVTFQNPGGARQTATMVAVAEFDSLLEAIPFYSQDPLALPVEGEVLDESGLGYIKISTFAGDYKMMTDLWDHYVSEMIDNRVPGLIIDVRVNGGGSGNLALDFAGYFFREEIVRSQRLYYNDISGEFEVEGPLERVVPASKHYRGAVALLVSPDCVSACEGFAYAVTLEDRAIVVGHYPSAGAYGEVGRGQYELPGDLTLQFPTGRSETLDGELILEGVGVVPDVTVPVTRESVLGLEDAVLDAAVEALLEELGQ